MEAIGQTSVPLHQSRAAAYGRVQERIIAKGLIELDQSQNRLAVVKLGAEIEGFTGLHVPFVDKAAVLMLGVAQLTSEVAQQRHEIGRVMPAEHGGQGGGGHAGGAGADLIAVHCPAAFKAVGKHQMPVHDEAGGAQNSLIKARFCYVRIGVPCLVQQHHGTAMTDQVVTVLYGTRDGIKALHKGAIRLHQMGQKAHALAYDMIRIHLRHRGPHAGLGQVCSRGKEARTQTQVHRSAAKGDEAVAQRKTFKLAMLACVALLFAACERDAEDEEADAAPMSEESDTMAALDASTLTPMQEPLVIAHRGASGYLPEHTLAAYELAIDMGADVIEPDLVMTQDGVLIARHDVRLDNTTNVTEVVPTVRGLADVDGEIVQGWFSHELTLAQIEKLEARQRVPGRPEGEGLYRVPTFTDILDLAERKSEETGRVIGIYPELKHPAFHRRNGLDMEAALVAVLRQYGLDKADSPVFVQCFEVGPLRRLAERIDTPLVQLVGAPDAVPADAPTDPRTGEPLTYGAMLTPEGLAQVATYAAGLGPHKSMVMTSDGASTGLLTLAHEAGLVVHPWTFRTDDPGMTEASALAELEAAFALGVDGVFADFPDHAVKARAQWRARAGSTP